MCQSIVDGGQRCAAHARVRFEAADIATPEWDDAAAEYASTPAGRNVLAQTANDATISNPDFAARVSAALNRGDSIRQANQAAKRAIQSNAEAADKDQAAQRLERLLNSEASAEEKFAPRRGTSTRVMVTRSEVLSGVVAEAIHGDPRHGGATGIKMALTSRDGQWHVHPNVQVQRAFRNGESEDVRLDPAQQARINQALVRLGRPGPGEHEADFDGHINNRRATNGGGRYAFTRTIIG